MLMIQYTHEDVNRIFMQNQQNFLDPWNPLESFPCCYRNASDLHFTKEQIASAIESMGLPPAVRGETLTLEQFAKLTDLLVEL